MTDQTAGPAKQKESSNKVSGQGDVIELDPEILANLENSIQVEARAVKSGWFGKLYETICNAPIVITSTALYVSGDAAGALNAASGLPLVLPIYGAMAFGTYVHSQNRKQLELAHSAYRKTGDAAYVDLVSAHLASEVAPGNVPLVKGEKLDHYKESFRKHALEVKPSLAERVKNVGRSLRSLRPKHAVMAVKALGKGGGFVLSEMGHDVKALLTEMPVKSIPKAGLITRRTFNNVAHNLLSRPSVPHLSGPFDLVSYTGLKAEELTERYKERYITPKKTAYQKPSVPVDVDDEEEKVIGFVETAEDVSLKVDKDHLERTQRNIDQNTKRQKYLLGAALVGIGFEGAFVVKYTGKTIDAAEKTIGSIKVSVQEIAASGMDVMQSSAHLWGNSSGDLKDFLIYGFSGTLMASAAWHHLLKSGIGADEEIHDQAVEWSETVKARQKLDDDIHRLAESLSIIFDPEVTDQDEMRKAGKRAEKIVGGITRSSLPPELREQLDDAQRRDRNANAVSDEFGSFVDPMEPS